MAYDLRFEKWIPYLYRDGSVDWNSPAHLTDGIKGANPIVDIYAYRHDFHGAMLEFLIGLLTVLIRPETDDPDWLNLWKNPPPTSYLAEKLGELPDAFRLDGSPPRFLQDFDNIDVETQPISTLLIDMPGENTWKNNTDIFQHEIELSLGLPAVAMALITMQTYAPGGGPGHRASMRGLGPLTTLIEPLDPETSCCVPLWNKLWANVPCVPIQPSKDDVRLIFPWMDHTICSGKENQNKAVFPGDANELQCFFGMPRRIRLEIDSEPGFCSLTNTKSSALVREFKMKNYGIRYNNWLHPLSPYKKNKDQWHSMHGSKFGIGWHDWAGLIYDEKGGKEVQVRRPAAVVAHFRNKRYLESIKAKLHVFGYIIENNAKAQEWQESRMPLWPSDGTEKLEKVAKQLTTTTNKASARLRKAYKKAFIHPNKGKYSKTLILSTINTELWSMTEEYFYNTIKELAEDKVDCDSAIGKFAKKLSDVSLEIFDRYCPFTLVRNLEAQVNARNELEKPL